MSFPKQNELEVPLLKALEQLGGAAKPKDVYSIVAKPFADQLTEEDLAAKLPSSPSTFEWHNLVQWSRQALIDRGEIDGSTRGLWRITAEGQKRITNPSALIAKPNIAPIHCDLFASLTQATLQDLVYQNEGEVKRRIISELKALSSQEFEQFCVSLLRLLGYQELKVTANGADGGIDGFGLFRQGVVTIRSAFQAKRWKQTPVGRPEIDKFRGAIQGDYDHGVFLTTARFTSEAEAASIKKGAISLLLLDGEAIAETMIRSGIGVLRRPVHLLDIDPAFFQFQPREDLL
jgi:restriction system protein